jgi:hypothetical protein
MHRPLDQEPEIVVNGVRLSRAQAKAVRVAVTDFNAQMTTPHAAECLGSPLASAYLDRTNEVIGLMLAPRVETSIPHPKISVFFNEMGASFIVQQDITLTNEQMLDLSDHVSRFKAPPHLVDKVALQEAVDAWGRRLVANNHIELDYITGKWVQR